MSSITPFKVLLKKLKEAIAEYEKNPNCENKDRIEMFSVMIALHAKNGDNPSPEVLSKDLKFFSDESNPLEKESNKN